MGRGTEQARRRYAPLYGAHPRRGAAPAGVWTIEKLFDEYPGLRELAAELVCWLGETPMLTHPEHEGVTAPMIILRPEATLLEVSTTISTTVSTAPAIPTIYCQTLEQAIELANQRVRRALRQGWQHVSGSPSDYSLPRVLERAREQYGELSAD